MSPTRTLELIDTVSFVSLLKCQKELARMKPGDSLEVVTNDADIAEDLIRIVQRSNDRILERSSKDEHVIIKIGKGKSDV